MKLIAVEYSTGQILGAVDVPPSLSDLGTPAVGEGLWFEDVTVTVKSVAIQNFAGGQVVTCIVDRRHDHSNLRRETA